MERVLDIRFGWTGSVIATRERGRILVEWDHNKGVVNSAFRMDLKTIKES